MASLCNHFTTSHGVFWTGSHQGSVQLASVGGHPGQQELKWQGLPGPAPTWLSLWTYFWKAAFISVPTAHDNPHVSPPSSKAFETGRRYPLIAVPLMATSMASLGLLPPLPLVCRQRGSHSLENVILFKVFFFPLRGENSGYYVFKIFFHENCSKLDLSQLCVCIYWALVVLSSCATIKVSHGGRQLRF